MDFSIADVDWRALLLKRYKHYHLTEDDVMVIFMCDLAMKADASFCPTAEFLLPYMTLSEDQIDQSLVKLMGRKPPLLGQKMKGGMSVFTLDPLFNLLLEDFKKDLVLDSRHPRITADNRAVNFLSNVFGRQFTAIEMDRINDWLTHGVSLEAIQTAVANIQQAGQKVTLNRLDKTLAKIQAAKAAKALENAKPKPQPAEETASDPDQALSDLFFGKGGRH